MRDDLLGAQACLDWAKTQLIGFFSVIESWQRSAPYRFVEEPHPEIGQQLIKLADVKPLHPRLNAEIGFLIHAMRSALDLLVVALAERNGHVEPTDVYFPFANSAQEFIDPINGAIEKIARLSAKDRVAIEKLKPYGGGDDCLFALHKLDLTRKHRRLLGVRSIPSHIAVTPHGMRQGLGFPTKWPGFHDGAVVAWTAIGATNYEPQITLAVAFERTGLPVVEGKWVTGVLPDFYTKVRDIIAQFDVP